ncbi:two-component system sensor histidine kinase NtrB [Brevibacillus dissolubilis]|uniref:two-component system sensor histidine kinase NtrB n=1 Tax=Brevibacillus dissolubilis TaxID=1844116 RepID=UPI0011165668|nr:HAMP domain-containing sensor histidine kinase [Brevibacillus dissolubilis]
MNLIEWKEKLLPLFLKQLETALETHLAEIELDVRVSQGLEGIEQIYCDLIKEGVEKNFHALFFEETDYQQYKMEMEAKCYERGHAYAEGKQISKELILKLSHNLRMHVISNMYRVMDSLGVSSVDSAIKDFLIERQFDLSGTQLNGIVLGYLDAREYQIHRLSMQTQNIMGHMAAGVAHEIRNPITSFQGFLQLMEKSVEQRNVDPTMFLHYIQVCKEEIASLEGLVKNFLILSNKNDTIKKELGPVNLTSTLHRVYEIAKSFVYEKNVYMHFYYPQDQCWINGVSSYVEQICLNLIKNAIDAVDEGGHLFVETVMDHSNEQMVIMFRDNGRGIPEGRLKHIFEPFFNTTEKGTGMGMSICKRLVEEMKGTIAIESLINRGTKVEVRLPLISAVSSL